MPLVTPLAIGSETCKAKVDYLNHPCFFFDQDVVELDVSMRYTLSVKILKALRYLLEEPSARWLFNDSVRTMHLDVMVHTYAVYEVCHDADLFLSFY